MLGFVLGAALLPGMEVALLHACSSCGHPALWTQPLSRGLPLHRACQVQHWQKHKVACNLMAGEPRRADDL